MELAAQTVDLLAILNVNFIRANSKPTHRVPDPVLVPRPGDRRRIAGELEQAAPRMATKAELKAFFGGNVRYTPTNGELAEEAP